MNQESFLQLLQGIQTPDNDKIKAATVELRKTYYPNPESLLWLLQILTSHQDHKLRHQAAVESLRLVPKHWSALQDGQRPAIRQQVLEATVREENTLVRHSASRVVSAIAKIDLADGEWNELPGLLAQASTSQEVRQREVGVYILFTLMEATGDIFIDKLSDLFTLFSKTIKDPESSEVRVNTMMALSRVAMLFDVDEDTASLEAWRAIFPDMVAVLKQVIDAGDDDRTMAAFEVFQTLLGCESALMSVHLKDLVQFMLDIAANTGVDDDARSQAISFLMQCVKYRKMKVQAMNGMGEQLVLKGLQIVTEIADDDDDELGITPSRSALGLIDLLASSLPPRQVIVPLLKHLPEYTNHHQPSFRKAGILALSYCVEGAPDFLSSQLSEIFPPTLKLLSDPEITVRQAALHAVASLSDELPEDMAAEHEKFIPVLMQNLDSAIAASQNPEQRETSLEIIKASCGALESFSDGMESKTMANYATELVPRLGQLLDHEDLKVKASAAGALGAVAGASEELFMPYFENSMKALSRFVEIKDSDDELDLRATVCDAMGSMAAAVGPSAFAQFLKPLMQASEEGLHLGHPRLRETSYILWSTMVKIYESDFKQYLDGVVKGLLDCLDQEESDMEVELGEHAKDLVGQEVTIGGKKVKVTSAVDDAIEDIDALEAMEEDDEEDWDDLSAVTAIALEKEIAVEVLADVLSHTRADFLPYLENTIESIVGLVEHPYEGVKKAAVSTLWRAYACLWALMEDHTGTKWAPGFPLKQQPTSELVKMGEVVATATMSVWGDEMERDVVTDINRNVAAVLKTCGPAILTVDNMAEQIQTIVAAILTKNHPCQTDFMADDEDAETLDENSEYDWLVIDTALDVLIGLSVALGPQFGPAWKTFEKPVMKFASSQENFEKSTAVGVIAECIAGMGDGCTPYTKTLLPLLLHRLSDADLETRSNATYAIGLLVFHSTDSAAYLPSYNQILSKLEPHLQTTQARLLDNAAGCVSRMIMAHPDRVPIADVLPVVVGLLPLKEDFEENRPIYECIVGLYQHGEPTVQGLTPKLLPILQSVLSPPENQLDSETRSKVQELVNHISK